MREHAEPVLSGHIGAGHTAFAALDLGSNNCRMMVAIPAGRGFRVIDSYSRLVRLGEGLQHSGALSDAAMDRTIGALHACATRLSRRHLRGVRAVATEACRRAANGGLFLERVRDETGLAIDVISAREEAELALESCAALLHTRIAGEARPPVRGLLFDIGGGSTEIAWVRLSGEAGRRDGGARQKLIGYQSLPLGVITMAELFGARMFEPGGYEDMVEHVEARLAGFEDVHCIGREIRQGGVRLVGTSGTITTVASVAMRLQHYRRALVDGVSLSREQAHETIAALRRAGRGGLALHGCVGPERAGFVLPGCAIFEAIHRLWPTPSVTVADRGLRDGMLLRMMRDGRRAGRELAGWGSSGSGSSGRGKAERRLAGQAP